MQHAKHSNYALIYILKAFYWAVVYISSAAWSSDEISSVTSMLNLVLLCFMQQKKKDNLYWLIMSFLLFLHLPIPSLDYFKHPVTAFLMP